MPSAPAVAKREPSELKAAQSTAPRWVASSAVHHRTPASGAGLLTNAQSLCGSSALNFTGSVLIWIGATGVSLSGGLAGKKRGEVLRIGLAQLLDPDGHLDAVVPLQHGLPSRHSVNSASTVYLSVASAHLLLGAPGVAAPTRDRAHTTISPRVRDLVQIFSHRAIRSRYAQPPPEAPHHAKRAGGAAGEQNPCGRLRHVGSERRHHDLPIPVPSHPNDVGP
jgi:hypothetical protein